MFHFYDHDAQTWRAIEHPSIEDIATALAGVRPACRHCDAAIEWAFTDVTVVHEDGCPGAA